MKFENNAQISNLINDVYHVLGRLKTFGLTSVDRVVIHKDTFEKVNELRSAIAELDRGTSRSWGVLNQGISEYEAAEMQRKKRAEVIRPGSRAWNELMKKYEDRIDAPDGKIQFDDDTEGDGSVWIFLKPGWHWEGCHFVHEWGMTALEDSLRTVCNDGLCNDCAPE